MKFKLDLKMDFETYQKHPDTPIFHRIRFDSTSIYLTKSTFYKLTTSRNEHGSYRVFSWDDWRAKAFLGFELGDQSPALGCADLIGHFNPITDDLTDIQYETPLGKAFFQSARRELEEDFDREEPVKKQKINSYEFMRMNEIIPTGAQGKAIYGEGNYIIDGPAGTGKSTTVLQKIKLLQKNDNVETSKICILVKNEMVVSEFYRLLKSMGIGDLRIMTPRDFISEYFSIKLDANSLNTARDTSLDIRDCFKELTKEEMKLSNNLITGLGDNDKEIIRILGGNKNISKNIYLYIAKRKEFVALVLKNRKTLNNEQSELNKNVEGLSKSISEKVKKKKNRGLRSLRTLLSSKGNAASLGLDDEAKIRDEVNKYKSKEENKLNKLKKRHIDSQTRVSNEVKMIVKNIELALLSNDFAQHTSENEEQLVFYYINKLIANSSLFHTVIVDEAQDVSLLNIELAWLLSKNIILTGDELQAEREEGIGYWENLAHLTKEFSIEKALNIFTLKHNFRQTYELGNCSFNYRQLIMEKPFSDLNDEYFENQKGFPKPQLAYIDNVSDFIGLVENKINLINEIFTDSIPVVIFYENKVSLKKLSEILDESKISYSVDDNKNKPVMFVSLDYIAGRSFPVVLAPLTNNTKDNTIYIMLSRAKYDLSLFTGSDKKLNPYIENLLSKEIIVTLRD